MNDIFSYLVALGEKSMYARKSVNSVLHLKEMFSSFFSFLIISIYFVVL